MTAQLFILTHGWPGSIVEFLDIIGPLTDPRSYGEDPADAFHLVIPSIPGFGFSGPPSQKGWNGQRIALAWAELMRRLGYERYGAQGGDWGSIISRNLAALDPEHVCAVHLNYLIVMPKLDDMLRNQSKEDEYRIVKELEVGYLIERNYWGEGLGTEAAQGIRDFAFQTYDVSQLISLVQFSNHASRRVAEKIGMHLWKVITFQGVPNVCVYRIQREMWMKNNHPSARS